MIEIAPMLEDSFHVGNLGVLTFSQIFNDASAKSLPN
jgi:hypothetical protein